MAQDNLVKKAWSLLTRDKGWIKPILVMPIADLVPIAGAMGTHGYALEWARLTAWGVDAAPKQKNVQVGKCIAVGARAFVVGLGFTCVFWLLLGLLQLIAMPLPEEVQMVYLALLSMVQFCVNVVYATFTPLCFIRSAIYESIGAGYRVDRVCQMIGRDSSGFMKLVAINVAVTLIFGAVAFIAIMLGSVFVVPAVLVVAGAESMQSAAMVLLPLIAIGVIFITAVVYGMGVLAHMYSLMFYTVIALWMRQFNVPAWGKSSDPLPDSAPDVAVEQMSTHPAWQGPASQGSTPAEPVKMGEPASAIKTAEPVHESESKMRVMEPLPQEESFDREKSEPTGKGVAALHDVPEPEIEIVDAFDEDQGPAQEHAPVESAGGEVMESTKEDVTEDDVEQLYSQLNDLMHRDDR